MTLFTERSEFGLVELLAELRGVRDRLLGLEREMRKEFDSRTAAIDEMKRSCEEMARYEEKARSILLEVERIREELALRAASVEAEMQKQLEATLSSGAASVEEFVRSGRGALDGVNAALHEALSGIREAGEGEVSRLRAGFREVVESLREEVKKALEALLRRHEASVRALESDLRREVQKAADDLRGEVARQMERIESGMVDLRQVRGEMEGLRAATMQRIKSAEERILGTEALLLRLRQWLIVLAVGMVAIGLTGLFLSR